MLRGSMPKESSVSGGGLVAGLPWGWWGFGYRDWEASLRRQLGVRLVCGFWSQTR